MTDTAVTIAAMTELIQQIRGQQPLPGVITHETRFMADLGLDSMQVIGLAFLWEQTFGVSISEQEDLLARLETVGQAIDAIRSMQASATSR
jgi:acyl carrier protein